MGRVLIIGLDGADFDVIKPFVAQGHLPNLGRLMQTGSHGPLRSTYPPMSPPAWTTFMTGKNPGKHGIFDFTVRKPDSYQVEFVNARFRKAATMWQLMSEAGKRICILSVPITFPPEKVNGIQISGIDTPGVTGGLADPTAVHPPELHQELLDKLGGYLISPNLKGLENRPVAEYVEAAFRTIDRKMESAQYLYAKERWDCFMITIGETDGISHRLWHYHDKRCPMGDAASAAHQGADPLLQIYQRIDQHIGKLCAAVSSDTTIFVMSDHGHAGNGNRAIYLNRWLAQRGLLAYQTGAVQRVMQSVLGLAKKAGTKNIVPLEYRKKLFRKTKLAGQVESYLRFARLDWNRTKAYSEETPYYPTIWINTKGREPQGVVAKGTEYEALRDTLIRDLLEWKDPDTGRSLVKKVHKREELYTGDFIDKFPDLVIDWNLDGEYSYLFKTSHAADASKPAVGVVPERERAKSKSGDHRDDGMFIAAGAHIVPGELKDADILDLAPTFLYRLGLPVPEDMDGKVLARIFDAEFQKQHPVQFGAGGAAPDAMLPAQGEYSEEEEEAVRKRLQGLGYLE